MALVVVWVWEAGLDCGFGLDVLPPLWLWSGWLALVVASVWMAGLGSGFGLDGWP